MIDPDHRRFFHQRGIELLEHLGEGGTGVVYRARQTDLDRQVALKVFEGADGALVRTLDRELTAARGLRHQNLVTIYGGGTTGRLPHLVLELAEPTADDTRLELRAMLSCGVKLASVLGLAHASGIVHSDVKPDNILWHRGREPLLGDFGSAVIEAKTLMRGHAGHTPLWAPPWFDRRQPVASPTTDVWSLAASLLWFHLGRNPRTIEWDELPDDLRHPFRLAMPLSPDERPLGLDPALTFGRVLQQVQHQRGQEVTAFPASDHVNWSPSVQTHPTVTTTGGATVDDEAVTGVVPAVGRSVPAPGPAPTVDRAAATRPAGRPRRRWPSAVVAVLAGAVVAGAAVSVLPDLLAGGKAGEASSDGSGTDLSGRSDGESPDVASGDATVRTRPLWFAASNGSDPDLYLLDLDDSSTALTAGTASDVHPTVSPDGARYAFESNRDGIRGVYLAPVDGTSEPVLLSPVGVEAVEPAWDPTGDRLAWATPGAGSWDIVVHDLDRGVTTAVVDGASDDRAPAWSPDGTALVFRSDRTGAGDLYTIDLASRVVERITDSADPEDHPAWGPDDTFAYDVEINGDTEVFTVGVDDAPVRRTARAGFDGYPVFDGDLLLAVRRDGSRSSIVADPGGEHEVEVFASEGSVQDLSLT